AEPLINLTLVPLLISLCHCYLSVHLLPVLFLFSHSATTDIYTLSLHDALPIWQRSRSRSRARSLPSRAGSAASTSRACARPAERSEEHTSELQSRVDLVCRLLLEKKKKLISNTVHTES